MSDICESLLNEHRVIERVLNAMESECNRIDGGTAPNRAFIERAIQFIRQFADGIHHHKEERVLFPCLEQAGVPSDGGPVGVMLSEHDLGRRLVATIEAQLAKVDDSQPKSTQALLDAMRGYIELLRGHIYKEDNILFPMAGQACSDSQKEEVRQLFAQAEDAERTTADTHRAWAESL